MKKIFTFIIVCMLVLSVSNVCFAATSLYSGGTVANTSADDFSKHLISTNGLKSDYSFSGHIKILEMGSNPWDGIRIVTGVNGSDEVSALVLTKEWGVRVEFKGDNMSDFFTDSPHYGTGDEFDFKVTKEGADLKLYIFDTLLTEVTIPAGKDAFTAGAEMNLGFTASGCKYEVSNIVVTNTHPDATEPVVTNPKTGDILVVSMLFVLLMASSLVFLKRQKV